MSECFWAEETIVGLVKDCPPPAGAEDIQLWGGATGGGGILFDKTQPFNTPLAGATSVQVVAYYTPAVDDPPDLSEPSVSLASYTKVPTSIPLATGEEGVGTNYWWASREDAESAGLAPENWYLCRLSVDGTVYLAIMVVSAGW